MELITTQELGALTPTKTNIDIVAKEMALPVLSGNIDAIEFAIRCEFAIKCLEQAKKNAQENAIKAVGKEANMLGAKIEVVESGTKYDYTTNETWQNIEQRLKPILDEKKAIEEQIKMATKIGKSIMDDDTGEIVASPVTKSSTTTLKITLGK